MHRINSLFGVLYRCFSSEIGELTLASSLHMVLRVGNLSGAGVLSVVRSNVAQEKPYTGFTEIKTGEVRHSDGVNNGNSVLQTS
jgi:hypothetical protein